MPLSHQTKTTIRMNGFRFELFLEKLLIDIELKRRSEGQLPKYCNVQRNVCFHKSKKLFRQVDLTYNSLIDGKRKPYFDSLTIIEAKFTGLSEFPYRLRQTKKKCGSGTLDNIIDEVLERQEFVGAHRAYLVTNSYFSDQVVDAATQNNIGLLQKPQIQSAYEYLGNEGCINKAIRAIKLSKELGHYQSIKRQAA